jgi:hypothetical protein
MLNLKKTAVAVLAFGSSAAFAGTMGPVCTPGSVTVPCESVAWDVGVYALYLKPSYNNSIDHVTVLQNGVATAARSHDLDYDWGFKLEASYHFSTGNDMNLNWYHYDNSDSHHRAGDFTFFGPSGEVDVTGANGVTVVSPKWDAVNLEFGQHVDFGEFKNIRFHGGFQYARIETDVKHKYVDGAGVTYSEKSASKFTGFGPRVGADMAYDLGNGLAMYANGAVALLAGDHDVTGSASNSTVNGLTAAISAGSDTVIVPELEAKAGMKYTYAMAQGELTLDGGWMWVDYIGAQKSVPSLSNSDFGMQGPYLGLKWVGAAFI